MNIPDAVYFHKFLGHSVVGSQATFTTPRGYHGRVGLVLHDRPEGWIVKLTRLYVPNMVSCEIVSGDQITPLIGAYLPPSTLAHLPYLE